MKPQAFDIGGNIALGLSERELLAASLSSRQRLLAAGLTASAGFVDGLFFIHLGGYFVSFMSGNSTRAAADLAQGNYQGWLMASLLIAAFVLGVMLSSLQCDTVPNDSIHPQRRYCRNRSPRMVLPFGCPMPC